MSNLSAPKLKADFMYLYKGMYQTGARKSPTSAAKPTLLQSRKEHSAKKIAAGGSKDKRPSTQTQADPNKSIGQLFRSSGKVEIPRGTEQEKSAVSPTTNASLRAKTSQEEKREPSSNIVFKQRATTKGSPSRGSSANSKKKNGSNVEIAKDLKIQAMTSFSKQSGIGFKPNVSYKSIPGNYSSMFGKKERETSKGSRSSQRRLSNNTSTKLQACKPQLGRDKLTRLLQPSTPSDKIALGVDAYEKIKGQVGNSTKRKNSSSNSINKKPSVEPRSSIAGKSTTKISPAIAGGLSYLSAKTTLDLKKEIIANKIIGNMRMTKKPEDSRPTTKGNPTILSSLVTQVSKPFTNHADGSPNQTGMHTDKSSKTLKKKKKTTKEQANMLITFKNHGIFYMHKLELSFKECKDDEESSLFRLHFKNTIQSLSLLANVGKTITPFEDKQRITLPPLKHPSSSELYSRHEDNHLRSR